MGTAGVDNKLATYFEVMFILAGYIGGPLSITGTPWKPFAGTNMLGQHDVMGGRITAESKWYSLQTRGELPAVTGSR
jgi:hypothetical protein